MAAKKKHNKHHGHYCYVCGEHKANEKFSGHGHAHHICKMCHALPIAKRNEMVTVRKIDNMAFRYISKADIKWLRDKMNDPRPEVRDAACGAYNFKFPNYNSNLEKLTELKTPVLFSELDDSLKAETVERLEELIGQFLSYVEYIPDEEDKDEILKSLCGEISDSMNQWEPEPYSPSAEYYDPRFDFGPEVSFDERFERMKEILDADAEEYDPYAELEEPEPTPQKELIPDNALRAAFDEITAMFVADLKSEGINLPTFMETLIVTETKRLIIRRFHKSDFDTLCAIMKKPEVMYAWESGFKKSETRKWLNRQYTRYHKDGFGYYAVILKDTGKLIGQAGLIKSDVNGESVVEIGYIFDDAVWGQGNAIEAASACVDLAFNRFGIGKLYATIRPGNVASIKLAEKLGMRKNGSFVKTYQGEEMMHDIYTLEP